MLTKIFAKIEKFVPQKYRWILSHEGFKRYFANTGWMFSGQAVSLISSFFIGVWIARYLGPENYGIINYAAAFVGVFGFIAGLGIDGIVNRDLVKNPEQESALMGTGFSLKALGGGLAFLSVLVANYFVSATPLMHLLIILYGLSFLISPVNIISTYFQSQVQAKNNVKVNIFTIIVSSILKVAFIFSGLGIVWLVVIYALNSVWQAGGFIYTYRRQGHKFITWVFNSKLAKRLWRDGWPLMLSGAAIYVYLKIDQVMIGWMMGNKEVGLYSAAVKLAEVWYFIPGMICASLFPAIINAKKTNEKVYRHRLHNLYWLMVVISVAMALPISVFAKPIVLFLFGSSYLLSAPILQIYIWSGLSLSLGIAINQYLMAENRTRLIFYLNLVAMITNVALNFWLIPKIGLYGAAVATLISYSIVPIIIFSGGDRLGKRRVQNK